MMMPRLTICVLLGTLCCAPATAAVPAPNVVVILADDQGWGDLSLHGNRDLATPHIDSLAREGAQFEHFYVSPVCSPTRAEFLTGRYFGRTGVTGVTGGHERLNLDEHTVAEAFQQAGYTTGCFGKWHNGMQYPYHPRARGFNTFTGFCSGHWGDYFDPELERDGTYFKAKGYITDIFTEEAIRFIKSNKHQPFFCYLPLCTPHSPMQVPDRYWDRHKDKPFQMDHPHSGPHTRAALAMVENIDDNVGRLLDTLDQLHLASNTIVLYFSDNGPNGARWNGGMRGIKGSTDEGGLRSPLLIRWPGKVTPGTRVNGIAGAIDLLPTLTELAGIPRVGNQPLDGISLAPALTANQPLPSRSLFSRHGKRVSVRTPSHRLDAKGRLYDLTTDPGQQHDIARDHPELTRHLQAQVEQWKQSVDLSGPLTERPFPIGHADWPLTELPARDAATSKGLKRSSIHPNCSYFHDWTRTDSSITWPVNVLTAGRYEAIIYYACPSKDVGSTIELRLGGQSVHRKLTEAHDPPLEGEQENRVQRGESLTRDFKPWSLGTIDLPAGTGTLELRATDIPGSQALEFRRLMLKRLTPGR